MSIFAYIYSNNLFGVGQTACVLLLFFSYLPDGYFCASLVVALLPSTHVVQKKIIIEDDRLLKEKKILHFSIYIFRKVERLSRLRRTCNEPIFFLNRGYNNPTALDVVIFSRNWCCQSFALSSPPIVFYTYYYTLYKYYLIILLRKNLPQPLFYHYHRHL